MPNFELTVEKFDFPDSLPEARSTFRFLVDIRYIDPKGEFATAHAVLPGLDSYWECEKEHKGEASYVRDDNASQIDMGKIDEWDKLIVMLQAKELHSLQIRVFDIEKSGGFLDKLKEYSGMVVEALIGKAVTAAKDAVPGPPDFLKGAFGTATHDVEAFALAQLAGIRGQDSLLFKKSKNKDELATGNVSLKGAGTKGEYEVGVKITKTG
jgi:hypothetical protein